MRGSLLLLSLTCDLSIRYPSYSTCKKEAQVPREQCRPALHTQSVPALLLRRACDGLAIVMPLFLSRLLLLTGIRGIEHGQLGWSCLVVDLLRNLRVENSATF